MDIAPVSNYSAMIVTLNMMILSCLNDNRISLSQWHYTGAHIAVN